MIKGLIVTFLHLAVALLPFSLGSAEVKLKGLQEVVQVLNGKSFTLADGQTVRLAAIQVPNLEENSEPFRAGEPQAEGTKAALTSLIEGKQVRLDYADEAIDRKGRHVAQVYLEDETWVQEQLVKEGMAMVYPFADTPAEVVDALMRTEGVARAAALGIWSEDYFQPIEHTHASAFMDRYKLVTGQVMHVAEAKGTWYINFGENWKTDFTVRIDGRARKRFGEETVQALEGKRVMVRGWIYSRNGPMVDLVHPGQIHIIQ